MGNAAAIVHYAEVTAPCQAASSSSPSSATDRRHVTVRPLCTDTRIRCWKNPVFLLLLLFSYSFLQPQRHFADTPIPRIPRLRCGFRLNAPHCFIMALKYSEFARGNEFPGTRAPRDVTWRRLISKTRIRTHSSRGGKKKAKDGLFRIPKDADFRLAAKKDNNKKQSEKQMKKEATTKRNELKVQKLQVQQQL